MVKLSKAFGLGLVALTALGLSGCIGTPQPSAFSSSPSSVATPESPPSPSASAPDEPTATPESSPESAAEAIADGQESCTILTRLADDLAALQDQLGVDGTGASVDADVLQRIQEGITQSDAVAGPIVQPYVDAESQAFAGLRAGIEQGDSEAIQASGFTEATVAMTFYCLNNLDPDPAE
jgi:hypothetical protein